MAVRRDSRRDSSTGVFDLPLDHISNSMDPTLPNSGHFVYVDDSADEPQDLLTALAIPAPT
ncbi:MAG: hypothetical protein OXB92_05150 [Acidimicrobiaceae bacterium]|nr:hypothetical protein [Acidimicrobiia bacterium]MCY4493226.1 hypothetical protein [Acidimicrobiaceae bacterium]